MESADDNFDNIIFNSTQGDSREAIAGGAGDAMQAPHFIPGQVMRDVASVPTDTNGKQLFGTGCFEGRTLPDSITEYSTAISETSRTYNAILQATVHDHSASSYEVGASMYEPGTLRTVLEKQSTDGSTHIVVDTYGLTVDFFPADGTPPEYNHYYIDTTSGTVCKDTLDRAALMQHIPAIGSAPHQLRERAIGRARALAMGVPGITAMVVTPEEMTGIAQVVRDAAPQQISFMEVYALAQRRVDAKIAVSDGASEVAASQFEDNLRRHLERRGYDLGLIPYPTDVQPIEIDTGEYMYVRAGYDVAGDTRPTPVPTVMADTYVQINPEEAAAEIAASGQQPDIAFGTVMPAFRQRSVMYRYDPERRVLTGLLAKGIVCGQTSVILEQYEFNADADDVQYVNLFLQRQEF